MPNDTSVQNDAQGAAPAWLRDVSRAFMLSSTMVVALVANAYMTENIGYPSVLQILGIALVFISFIIAVPAIAGFQLLTAVGLGWELRGRESFIESNPGAWIYCIVFYTLLFFAMGRLRRWREARRLSSDAGPEAASPPQAGTEDEADVHGA